MLSLAGTPHMSEAELEACFELIEETSGEDYRQSSDGWHPVAKRQEMRSPELRYVLVKKTADDREGIRDEDVGKDALRGFISMMPTFETGKPVVYVYEIHLAAELQGSVRTSHIACRLALHLHTHTHIHTHSLTHSNTHVLILESRSGLGRQLMGYAQSTASNIPGVGKVMLTCFTRNEGGMRFYDKLGFSTHESSPRERRLRGGRIVTSDYVILIWRRGGDGEEEKEKVV